MGTSLGPASRRWVGARHALDGSELPLAAHTHEFFVVVYFEGEGGALHVGSDDWPLGAGDLFLVAPGDVVGIGDDVVGLHDAGGTAVWCAAEALGPAAAGGGAAWQAHPLLAPFAQPPAGTPKRLRVPVVERQAWSARLRAIEPSSGSDVTVRWTRPPPTSRSSASTSLASHSSPAITRRCPLRPSSLRCSPTSTRTTRIRSRSVMSPRPSISRVDISPRSSGARREGRARVDH